MFLFFPGQRYLHSLLGQQQEVNRKGEHPFLPCAVLPIRHVTAVCLEWGSGCRKHFGLMRVAPRMFSFAEVFDAVLDSLR